MFKRCKAEMDREERTQMGRMCGTAAAYRTAVGMLLTAQVLLWVLLWGYDRAGRTVWQAMLLLTAVGVAVWALSRWAWGGPEADWRWAMEERSPSRPGWKAAPRRWEGLVLLPCLALDAAVGVHTLLSLLHRLMPSYPIGVLRVTIPVLLTVGVLLGKRDGAAYGAALWRWVLGLLAVWTMVQVVRTQSLGQCYPLLGRGAGVTLKAAAHGLGALWPIGLVFLLPRPLAGLTDPQRGKPARTAGFVLVPLALGVGAALAVTCAAPWRLGDSVSAGQKLMALGRSGGSSTVRGLWVLFCLLGLMLSYCVALMGSQKLVAQVWPRLPGAVPALGLAALAATALWLWPDALPWRVTALRPWRLAAWLVAAAWAGIRRWRREKRR